MMHLAIRRKRVSVLTTVGPGHRGYTLRRFYVVLLVRAPGSEEVVFIGQDDTIIGWANCVDYAQAVVTKARQS